jgi:hypothetical protein
MAGSAYTGEHDETTTGDARSRPRRQGVARVRGTFTFDPRLTRLEVTVPADDDDRQQPDAPPRKRNPQLNRVIKDDEARRVAGDIIDHIKDDPDARDTLEAALQASSAGADTRRAVAKVARALADDAVSEDVRRVADRLDDPIVRAAMATAAERPDVAALLDKLDKGLGGALRDAVGIFATEPQQRDAISRAVDLAEEGPEMLDALGASFFASQHGQRGREAIEAALQIAGADLGHLDLLKAMGAVSVSYEAARPALAAVTGAITDEGGAAAMERVLGDERVVAVLRRLGGLHAGDQDGAVKALFAIADAILDAPTPRGIAGRLRRAARVARRLCQ